MNDLNIIYTKTNTRIYDSYKLNNKEIKVVVQDIIFIRVMDNKLLKTRTEQSYINEIKAHKRLYKLGLFRSHTKDADLEEPIKKWKEMLYSIIGM